MLPTGYHMLCELKQTVPLLEWELTPAEIRIGRETPFWVDETGTPTSFHPVQTSDPASGLWVRPHRFDDRLIRHGCQTRTESLHLAATFDDRLIRLGCQTSWTPWPIPSTLANRVICRGVQTPHRKSYALPRLGEPLSESHHAAR